MLSIILQGISLGISASATPGALQAYLINRTLNGGWRKGAPVAFGPLVSDPVIVSAILLLLDRLPAGYLQFISLAGGVYALYLSVVLWRQWQKRTQPQVDLDGRSIQENGLWRGALMSALSPGPYTFWTLINGPLLLSAWRTSWLHGVAFLVAFYTMFIGGMLVLVGIFHQARRFGPRLVRVLTLFSILILLIFAIILLSQGLIPG